MKNNTNEAKEYLKRALSNVPDDFALSEVKFHIRSALAKIENVEQKRQKRQVASENRAVAKTQQTVNPFARGQLELIEEMIAEQKSILEGIAKRKIQSQDNDSDEEYQLIG